MRIQTISVRFFKHNKHLFNYVCKFVVYKYAFSSIIYDYTPSKTYKLNRVEWSEDTIRSHVKLFLKLGWCRMEGSDLVFLSKKELNGTIPPPRGKNKEKDDYCNFFYKIQCNLNYKEVRTHLYKAVTTRKLRQMKYKRDKVSSKPQKVVHNTPNREGLQISFNRLRHLFGYKSVSSVKTRMTEIEKVTTDFIRRSFRPRKVYSERLGSFIFKCPCSRYYLKELD